MTSINTNTPSSTIRNNKRRRPISTTTKLLIGVAATTLFNNPNESLIEAKHPPSIHKNTKKNKHNTIRGSKPPIVPSNNNILIPLGSSNSNNINNEINGNDTLLLGSTNNGGNVNNGGRVIVVQPDNLGGSAHVASEWGGTEQLSTNNNNNSIQQNKQLQGSSGGTYHSWPHPDTFNDESSIKAHDPLDPSIHPGQDQNPNRNVLQPMGSTSREELAVNNKMGKGQMGGHSTKFHGWVLGSTGGIESGNQNSGGVAQPNNLGAQEPGGGDGGESGGVHYYQPNGYGSAASSQTEVNQSPQGSTSTSNGKGSEKYDTLIETAVVGSAEVAAELLGSPPSLLDEDMGHSVQVILRPRLTNDDGEVVNSPLGSSSSGATAQSGGNEPVVYYYDPAALQSTASSSTSTNGGNAAGEESSTPELTLPETVYDISGQALKLEDVHNGGKNEVFLEVQPRAVWGANSLGGSSTSSSRGGAHMSDRLSSLQAKLQFTSGSSSSSNGGGTQSQDQLIVFVTIATMAVMVGMLSAQRLRSKKLLESCMGLDDDDDEEEEEWTPNPIFGGQGQQQQQVRYDKKFDTETTGLSPRNNNGPTSPSNSSDGGFGALLGGRNSIGQGSSSNYYGTNDGGGLHFRGIGGDLEKFDV